MSAPEPPVQVEVVEDSLTTWERALDLIKNIVVILTCLVILYVVYRGYVAVSALQDGLEQLRDSFGGLGG